MKINLRKAALMRDEVDAEISSLEKEALMVKINVFETEPMQKLDQQLKAFTEAQVKVEQYLDIRRELRTLIAKYNAKSGVYDLLSKDGLLFAREQRQRNILVWAKVMPRLSDEAMKRKIEYAKHSDRVTNDLEFVVLPPEHVAQVQKELEETKRARRKIQDQLIILNVKTEIPIPSALAKLMIELGLD